MRYAKIYLLNNIPPIIKKVRNFDPHFDPHLPKKSQKKAPSPKPMKELCLSYRIMTFDGRGDGTRTHGLCVPNVLVYISLLTYFRHYADQLTPF